MGRSEGEPNRMRTEASVAFIISPNLSHPVHFVQQFYSCSKQNISHKICKFSFSLLTLYNKDLFPSHFVCVCIKVNVFQLVQIDMKLSRKIILFSIYHLINRQTESALSAFISISPPTVSISLSALKTSTTMYYILQHA